LQTFCCCWWGLFFGTGGGRVGRNKKKEMEKKTSSYHQHDEEEMEEMERNDEHRRTEEDPGREQHDDDKENGGISSNTGRPADMKTTATTAVVVTPMNCGAAFPKLQATVLDILNATLQQLHETSLQSLLGAHSNRNPYHASYMLAAVSKNSNDELLHDDELTARSADACIRDAQSQHGNWFRLWQQGRYPGLKWPERVYEAINYRNGQLMFDSGTRPLSDWMQYSSNTTKYIELQYPLFHLRSMFGCSLDPNTVVKLMPLKIAPEALHVHGFPAHCPFTQVGLEFGVQFGDGFEKWTNQTETAWLSAFPAPSSTAGVGGGGGKKDPGSLIAGNIYSDIKRPDTQVQQPLFAKIVPIIDGSTTYTSARALYMAPRHVWERSADDRFWATIDIHDDKVIDKYRVETSDRRSVLLGFTETSPGCIDNPLAVWLLNKQHVCRNMPLVGPLSTADSLPLVTCMNLSKHEYQIGPLPADWFRDMLASLRSLYKNPLLIPLHTGLAAGKLVLRIHPLLAGGKSAVKKWQSNDKLRDPDVSFALSLDLVSYF
jgi:hypothetical protein